jgi:hypothetical protein
MITERLSDMNPVSSVVSSKEEQKKMPTIMSSKFISNVSSSEKLKSPLATTNNEFFEESSISIV